MQIYNSINQDKVKINGNVKYVKWEMIKKPKIVKDVIQKKEK